ncbi:hypothetical protein E2R58_15130 [Paenibacillus amylolyticus]|uniref:hypothetical protein n=1 Tax=Paenibacillus amylolyticus TaxID=1451 RepID=UPI0010598FE1|nr:hypothetical protein [Paenibacillus amylolyticus]TDL70413.1 hypothetical protein E2R58_15130 [Paenibacillus amylolyticus]
MWEYSPIPKEKSSKFKGEARYYYLVTFDVPSKEYEGEIMVPSDEELMEDEIFNKSQVYLMNHFKETFGKFQEHVNVSISEFYDATL